jgi:hypothetical protein
MWNSTTPHRTGIPTILKLLRVICRLLAAFSPVIYEHLDESKHEYVEALELACSAFMNNIESPNP